MADTFPSDKPILKGIQSILQRISPVQKAKADEANARKEINRLINQFDNTTAVIGQNSSIYGKAAAKLGQSLEGLSKRIEDSEVGSEVAKIRSGQNVTGEESQKVVKFIKDNLEVLEKVEEELSTGNQAISVSLSELGMSFSEGLANSNQSVEGQKQIFADAISVFKDSDIKSEAFAKAQELNLQEMKSIDSKTLDSMQNILFQLREDAKQTKIEGRTLRSIKGLNEDIHIISIHSATFPHIFEVFCLSLRLSASVLREGERWPRDWNFTESWPLCIFNWPLC